jgi:zinc protease
MTVVNAVAREMAGPKIEIVTSPCGVDAWLVEDHHLPLIAFECAFQIGTAKDPQGKAGLVHTLAGLLDEGAGDMDAEAFQGALADNAIEFSCSAERDHFYVSMKCLASRRDDAFRLLALALQRPRFDADAVERVKAQIITGLRREEQDPDAMARLAFGRAAFPDHPYGRKARGDIESVSALAPDDFARVVGAGFVRDGLHVVCVGAMAPDELQDRLEQVFAALPAKATLPTLDAVVMQGLGRTITVDIDLPQTTLRFGAPALRREDPDYIAAEIVNHILGGSAFTSRLFLEVREKRGLAYGVSSSLVPMAHTAYLVGGTATRNDRVAESLAVIRTEMAALAKDGPTADELQAAKDYLTGSFPLRFDTSAKIAHQLLAFSVAGLGADYVRRRNALFAAVTTEDAARAARRLYGDGRLLVVAVGRPVGLDG